MPTDRTEPKGSASSSPDELCAKCIHPRGEHYEQGTCKCDPDMHALCRACHDLEESGWRHGFVPAAGGTAGGPEAPEPRCEGCGHTAGEGCGCPPPGLHGEPEAPDCDDCDANNEDPAVQRVREELAASGPPRVRRPPYAVAYTVQGGAQYEIALPGDATVRAVDGALLITHDSAVLALTNVRPLGAEGQQ